MVRNKFKGVDVPVPNPGPVRYEPEVHDLSKGLWDDPHTMPLNASPKMRDVRFEGKAVRKDFGYTPVGDAAVSRVLGMWEHRYYDSNGNEQTRLARVIRQPDGEAEAQLWDGVDWDLVAHSGVGGETIKDDLVSMVSTLGELFVAGGEDDILYLVETQNLVTRQDDFATSLDLDTEGEYADVALGNEPAYNNEYTVSYEVSISFKWDGVDVGGRVGFDVLIWFRPDAGTWVQVDSQFYGLSCQDAGSPCTLSFTGTSAVRRTIDAQAHALADVGEVRVEIDSIVELNATSVGIVVKPCRITGSEDSYAGVEYQTNSPTSALTTVGTDSPHARFIFPFADRVIALGDASDVDDGDQTVSWSTSGIAHSGSNDAWTGASIGSGLVILQDTQGDPVNEMMAGVALGAEVAAIFRKRSIMRCWRTGRAAVALGFGSWFENVGTESPHSVKPVRGGAMFLGSDLMVYYLTAAGQLSPVGLPIHNTLLDDVISNFDLAYSEYDPIFEDYWLGVPIDGENFLSTVYVFSLKDFLDTQELVWRKKNLPNKASCFVIANHYAEV